MQLTPIKGFSDTPVSKSICVVTTLLAIGLSIFQYKYVVKLEIDPYMIEYAQYWRLFTYQLSVINESDFMLTFLLWFHFKNLERFFGSRKYLSLITVFWMYNGILCFLSIMLGQLALNFGVFLINLVFGSAIGTLSYSKTIFNLVTPGPLGILSTLYVCYGWLIPRSYIFTILISKPQTSENGLDDQVSPSKELQLTNHFQIHLIYLLLLLNNGFSSIIPCIVGIIIGKLFKEDILAGRNWLLPISILRIFVNPLAWLANFFHGRFSVHRGYRELNAQNDNASSAQQLVNDEDDDVLDEERANASEIRAETPVRPLRAQFLDAFRP